jgi:hypothetical protein
MPPLPEDHKFSWNFLMVNPKSDHGVVKGEFESISNRFLHTGGFARINTDRAKIYYYKQNETNHTTPDWKIHFSVNLEDIPKAWNIIAGVYIEHLLEFGMKATVSENWPENQRGREITVYIFQHDKSYENTTEQEDAYLYLGPEKEVEDSTWISFITKTEFFLKKASVRSSGCAYGDRPLPKCHYASIRNEAFIKEMDDDGIKEYIYPPNYCGYNAAGHKNPFENVISHISQFAVNLEPERI